MLNIPTLPLSLYIHLPWCIRKCPYCDFNSHALRDELPEQTYIDALIKDLDADKQQVIDRPLVSIFIGGGTPSLFSPQAIERILNAVQQRFHLDANIEITLEANPGTIEKTRFAGYFSAGVNRLSVGVQSFQADKLKVLGRIHDDNEAKRAVDTVINSGFTNFNVDLMHGLPNQSIDDALFDLNTALAFSPTHLSWYQLTLEANTFFAKHPPTLPPDDLIWEMQEQGQQLLADFNFKQYEISAYSQPNKQCVHNKNYWEFGDYLGIGAGAHSKITGIVKISPFKHTQIPPFEKGGLGGIYQITRAWKHKSPKDYLDPCKNFIAEEKIIPAEELAFEFMLNALRLYQPISIKLLIERTGLTLTTLEPRLIKARAKDLLDWNETTITTTDLGRRFYNDLVGIFLELGVRS